MALDAVVKGQMLNQAKSPGGGLACSPGQTCLLGCILFGVCWQPDSVALSGMLRPSVVIFGVLLCALFF